MFIYIRNMVSARCKFMVKSELEQLGLIGANVQLGRVELTKPATDEQITKLRNALSTSGLEVMHNNNLELVEQIKAVIREMIDQPADERAMTNSEYISDKLGKNYSCLATVFAEVTKISISQFVISYRIERTKAVIRQNNQSLSEIAFRFNYSSIGHLSNQFKQITGISPSVYRRIARNELRGGLTNGRLLKTAAPHAFKTGSSEAGSKPNFTENNLSINKI